MRKSHPLSLSLPIGNAITQTKRSPFRIAILYFLFGLLWIWPTDFALYCQGSENIFEFVVSVSKGTMFIVISSVVIYSLVRHECHLASRTTAVLLAVVENSPDSIFVKNREGKYVLINDTAAIFAGRSASDIIGKTDREILDEAQAQLLINRDIRIMKSESATTEEESLTANGVTRTFLSSKVPFRDETGEVLGLMGISRDITDRKKSEMAVLDAQRMLRMVLDNIPQGVFWKDRECRYLGCNKIVAQGWGLKSTDEVVGRSLSEFPHIPPEQAEMFRRADRQVIDTGIALYAMSEQLTRPDGRTVWLETTKLPLRDANDNIIGVLGTWEDVTDRKNSQIAIQEREELFRSTFEQAAVGIAHVSPENRFIRVNQRFAEITGYSISELLNRRFQDITHPDHIADGESNVAQLLANEIPSYQLEKQYLRASGEGVWVNLTVSLRRSMDGQPLYYISVIEDITTRKVAEEALRSSEERLRLLIEHAPAALAMFDLNMRYISYSHRWSSDYDLGDRDLHGLCHYDIFPDIPGHWRDAHQRCLNGEILRNERDQYIKSNGSYRWVRWEVRPWYDSLGKVAGIAILTEDINDRERSQTALLESEDRYRRGEALLSAVMDALPVSVIIADETGQLVRMNPASMSIWGPAPMSSSIKEYEEFVGYWPETMERIQPDEWPMSRAILYGESHNDVPVIIERFGNLSRRHLELSAAPVISVTGEMLGGVVVSMDVTERKAAYDELRRSEEHQAYLLQLSDALRPLADPMEILVTTTSILGKRLGADRVMYGEADPTDDTIFIVRQEYRREGIPPMPHPQRFTDFGSYILTAFRAGRTLEVADVQCVTEHSPSELAIYEATAIRAYAAVPLTKGKQILAYLAVNQSEPRVWTSEEIKLLEETAERTWAAVERTRADAAVYASAERYRLLLEGLPTAVFVHDGTEVTYCNPAFMQIMSAKAEQQLIGMDPFTIVQPDFHEVLRIGLTASTKMGSGMDIRILRLDGRNVPVYAVAMPVVNSGTPKSIVVLSDLSEREHAAELLRTIMGSVSDAILTIDSVGTIGSVNPATERLFGYRPEELVGKNVRILMPESHSSQHDQYLSNYQRTARANVIGIGREVEGLRKDGTTFPAELTVTEYHLDGNKHYTGVIRDITARRRLEEQFRQAQKMEAVGRLAGGVAHDFNNLLTVINGYADLIMPMLPQGQMQRSAVVAIRDAGERAAALTSQLLAFSRKAIVAPKVFDLKELIASSERMLRRLIGEDIILNVIAPTPCWVKADPNQIDQLVMNLAVNARDAMPTGGNLTFETKQIQNLGDAEIDTTAARSYIEFSVTDTGCGMSDEVKALIFEPFFTTKEMGKGTGLGLATVYGIVQQANGHITVESHIGLGTTFRVLLPEASGPSPSEVEPSHASSSGTETVLLVEDDDTVREICRIALESQGYEVLTASDGQAAIEVLIDRYTTVKLVITDVVMPQISGRELADAARMVVPKVKILFVSGYTDDAVFRHGVRESTDAFLQKPFTPLGLARKVRQVLDSDG